MNSTIKTILLTLLTLSVLTIAMIEVSGISDKKLSNLFASDSASTPHRHGTGGPEVDQADPLAKDPNAEKKKREEKARSMEKTVILVRDSIHDFGEIREGEKASHTYIVENVGDKPLYIANVATSCGCTAPEFSKEPVAPGESAEVTLEFNSSGKPGKQKKSALIISNASNAPYSIGFEAQVNK